MDTMAELVRWAVVVLVGALALAWIGQHASAAVYRTLAAHEASEDALVAQVRATHPATRSSTGAGDGTEAMLAALAAQR